MLPSADIWYYMRLMVTTVFIELELSIHVDSAIPNGIEDFGGTGYMQRILRCVLQENTKDGLASVVFLVFLAGSILADINI